MSFQDVGVDRPRQHPQLPPRQPPSVPSSPQQLYSSSSPLPQTHLQPSRSHNQNLHQEHLLMPNWQQQQQQQQMQMMMMTPPSTPPPPSYARLHERARQTLAGAGRNANNASPAVHSNSGSSTSGSGRKPYGHTPPSPVATPPPSMYPHYSPQSQSPPAPPPPPPQQQQQQYHHHEPQQPEQQYQEPQPSQHSQTKPSSYQEHSYDEFPSIHPPALIDAKTSTTTHNNNNNNNMTTTTTATARPNTTTNTTTTTKEATETDTFRSPPRRHLTPAAASASTGLFVLHGKVVDRTSLPVLHLHRPMMMDHDPNNNNGNYNEEDVMSAASSITLDVLPSVQSNGTHPSSQQQQSYYSGMSPERQQQQHQRLHLTAASNPAYSYVPPRLLYEDPQPTGAYAPYQLPIQQPVQHHLHQQQMQMPSQQPQMQMPSSSSQMQRQLHQPHLQQQQQQQQSQDLLDAHNNHPNSYQSNLANNSANDLNAIQQHIAARRARFSQLKSEILQFQNMVEELERTWPMTGESPETTWRARILWRSVEDANAELSQTLHDTEAELSHTPQARASFLQLYRDFRRVQRKYLMMSSRHLIEQQAQVTNLLFRQSQQQQQQQQQNGANPNNNNYSMKSGLGTTRASPATTVSSRSSLMSRSQLQNSRMMTPNTTSTASTSSMGNGVLYQQQLQQDRSTMSSSPPPAWSHPMAPQQQQQQVVMNSMSPPEGAEEDDFFVKAMREREQEVTNIQRSLRTVNEIYKELAGMVDIQQEQVDKVEGDIRYSRAATEVGLEHLQSANGGSSLVCSPMNGFSSTAAAAVTTVTTAASSPSAALAAALPNGLSLPSSLLMGQNDGSLCGANAVDSLDDDDIVLEEDKSSLISLPRIEETSSVSSNEKDTKTKQRSSPLGPIEFSESEYDESLHRNRRRRRRHRGSQDSEAETDLEFHCGKLDFPAIPKVLERVLEGSGGGDDANSAKQADEASVTPSMLKERDFRWSMPFETFREDMKAVHKDILNLGKDTFRMMTSNEGLCHCGGRL